MCVGPGPAYSMIGSCRFTFLTSALEFIPIGLKISTWIFCGADTGWSVVEAVVNTCFLIGSLCMLQLGISMCMFMKVFFTLAARNTTKVEDAMLHRIQTTFNPYDQGNMLANVSQIFGSPGLDWLLPVPPCRPLSDGIMFLSLSNPSESAKEAGSIPVVLAEHGGPSIHPSSPFFTTDGRPEPRPSGDRDRRTLVRSFAAEEGFGRAHKNSPDSARSSVVANGGGAKDNEESWDTRYRIRSRQHQDLAHRSWFFWLLGSKDPNGRYDQCCLPQPICDAQIRKAYWV